MANTKAKTQREYFNELKAIVADNAELVAFIDGRLAQLDKKSTAKSGPTETQIENAKLADEIADFMVGKTDVTIATIRKAFDLTAQKVTPIMKNMEAAGRVTKTVDKRTSYFTLA